MYSRQAYCADRGQHPRHHFKKKFKKMIAHKMAQKGRFFPRVNVQEFDDRYELFVYAAGYNKSDFEVNLKDNTLIISGKKPADWQKDTWKHQEFWPRTFERQFELNEKIDKENISAKYEDGILKITLEKLAGFETMRKEVEIN